MVKMSQIYWINSGGQWVHDFAKQVTPQWKKISIIALTLYDIERPSQKATLKKRHKQQIWSPTKMKLI